MAFRHTAILFAHRGASLELPENTLPSFRRALELGADALELDVHLSADGHVVVAHDPHGERTAGVRREIRACSLAELRGWDVGRSHGTRHCMPTLDELLEELPGVLFNIDLKPPSSDMVAAFLATVRRHRAEDRVIAASFSRRNLVELRARGYRGRTSLAPAEVARLLATPRTLLPFVGPAGDAAQLPVRQGPIYLGAAGVIRRCHDAGLRVDYWTVNDPDQARTLYEAGVDGVMTDDPACIYPVLAALRQSVGSRKPGR